MSAWTNRGDINPESGTFLVRHTEIDPRGDFRAECITVTPESDVGGDDRVFLLRQGQMFLSRKDIGSALGTIGATLVGDRIDMPGHHGEIVSTPLHSPDGEWILADAAHAYAGIDLLECDALVRVGLPGPYDPSPKFSGEIVVFTGASDFWAILRHQLDGVEAVEGVEIGAAEMIDTWDGPFRDLPRVIQDRADLGLMPAFASLGLDDAGNPKVWKMKYRHQDCPSGDTPEWEMTHSCSCDDACPDCAARVEPLTKIWVGPSEAALKDLWARLDDRVESAKEHEFDDLSEISF